MTCNWLLPVTPPLLRLCNNLFSIKMKKTGYKESAQRDSYFYGFIDGLDDAFRNQLEADETMTIILQIPAIVLSHKVKPNLTPGSKW